MNNLAQLIQPALPQQRRTRRPNIHFRTRVQPFTISPFFIHPVLPGETLKNALVQAKMLSAPINDGLTGWHAEMYFFYCRLTDLPSRDDFKQMVVDPEYDAVAAGLTSTTAVTKHFFMSNATEPGIDFVAECLQRVTEVFFRDDEETWNTEVVDGLPVARLTIDNALQSAALASEYAATTVDVDVDLDQDTTITASEVERARMMWQAMVSQGLTDKSYEDWVKSYGISLPREETNEPELIRYIRDWTYPTRLVDPSDGSPTSAVNWNIQDSIDKDRFFKEPGFLFGVQVFRPKVYLGNYEGSLTAYLKSGLSWLPGEALNSLAYGFREFAAASGPLPDASSAYVIDLRDLLQYGEQFVNFDLATSGKNIVALPNAGLTKKRYVSSTDVQSLFTGTDYHIETDGRLSLRIASRLGTDLSPSLE